MADIPELLTSVQAETDQWMAGLRDRVLNGAPQGPHLAGRMADAIAAQHTGMAGLGRVVITTARAGLACRTWIEGNGGKQITADGLANLIGIAGLVLIEREGARTGDGRDVRAVFATSVRRERLARGWTLDMMARQSGITRATILNIESQRTGTTLAVAGQFAKAFGMTIGALADGAGDGRG